ncbi:MAG: acyl-homoserine-lactone synthase [Burkholderiaceae bacterium]
MRANYAAFHAIVERGRNMFTRVLPRDALWELAGAAPHLARSCDRFREAVERNICFKAAVGYLGSIVVNNSPKAPVESSRAKITANRTVSRSKTLAIEIMRLHFGKINSLDSEIVSALFMYRYEVFVEYLGWSLPGNPRVFEIDEFDTSDAVYIIGVEEGEVCACARLLPTTQNYLLEQKFSHLLNGELAPKARDIWELSRFATVWRREIKREAMTRTKSFIEELMTYAKSCGVTELLTVSPLGMERIMRRLDIPFSKIGKTAKIDGKMVAAYRLSVMTRAKEKMINVT